MSMIVPRFWRISCGGAGVAQGPEAVTDHQALPAVIGAQRIATGGDEIEAGVKIGPGQGGVGAGGGDLVKKVGGVERPGAGGGEDVLAQHVARAGATGVAVKVVGADSLQCGLAFDDFKAVGGDQQSLGGGVVAVVGATDALNKAFDVLGGADLNDQIDIAPVDAEVEASGADHGPQRARDHGLFDPFALLAAERAVVDADGQGVVIGEPQVVEEDLGLGAGVVEDEGDAVLADLLKDRRDGVFAAAAGPGGRGVGDQHSDVGVRAGVGLKDLSLGTEEAGEGGRVFDRGAERPTRRRPGARVSRRAICSISWSPRLLSARA